MPVPSSPPNDDFRAAALRFFDDARALEEAKRWDGAVYLSGYVRECGLKHLLTAHTPGLVRLKDFGHGPERIRHPLLNLAAGLALRSPGVLAQAMVGGGVLVHHHPARRYWPNHWTREDAEAALDEATKVVQQLVIADLLDHGGALP